MKYLDTKENSIEDSVTRVLMGEKKLDPVNPTAVKKKFDDRKDKDIDNDGDVDSTDKYLHKRRKAVSKAIKSDEKSSVSENVKDIAMMMRDKKYKGRTSAFDSAVKKKYPKEYNTNAVQDLIRKHAEMNEQALDENFRKLAMMGIGTETKKGAKVGQTTDYYLPKTGDKSTGKIMRVSKDGYEIKNDGDLTPRLKGKIHKFKFYDPMNDKTSVRGMKKEAYNIGNDYAKHTLEVTPGQTKNDVDEMLGVMEKKRTSMREALAKVWGIDEGKSPFQKKEEMKKEKPLKKTMTGKEPTSVEVNPELKP